jgi:hypothetical protein
MYLGHGYNSVREAMVNISVSLENFRGRHWALKLGEILLDLNNLAGGTTGRVGALCLPHQRLVFPAH